MKRVLILGLTAGLLGVGNGCYLVQGIFCNPYPPCGACGPECGPVGDPCGAACGEPRGVASCASCGGSYDGGCAAGACPSCGDPSPGPCGPPCGCCGPLVLLAHLFRCDGCGCGAGCGEVYYGDWISEPPDCCDPCDGCGQWGGAGCGCAAGAPAMAPAPMREGYVSDQPPRLISPSEAVVVPGPAKPIVSERIARQRQRVPRQCSRGNCRQPL